MDAGVGGRARVILTSQCYRNSPRRPSSSWATLRFCADAGASLRCSSPQPLLQANRGRRTAPPLSRRRLGDAGGRPPTHLSKHGRGDHPPFASSTDSPSSNQPTNARRRRGGARKTHPPLAAAVKNKETVPVLMPPVPRYKRKRRPTIAESPSIGTF